MKKIILTLAIAIICASALFSQTQNTANSDTSYYVRITSPTDGYSVGMDCQIRGEARIPRGNHLWLFCHRADNLLWWAQNSPNASTPNWRVTVNVGVRADIGYDFEIVAIVVDNIVDAQIRASYGQGIVLPNTHISSMRTVRKISH